MRFLLPLLFVASGAFAQTASYGHYYRVACVPPLHYFAITREDYRGAHAKSSAITPGALEHYGLHRTPAQGTCKLGKRRIAWQVRGEDFTTHITLNKVPLIDGVKLLPTDADPMLSGFELTLDYAKAVHELAVHGEWEARSAKQKKRIGLTLTGARAEGWFPRCTKQCASYHFIQFSSELLKNPVPKTPKTLPFGKASTP